jgi:hypothetical protein
MVRANAAFVLVLLTAGLAAGPGLASAADSREKTLNARFRGGWVIVQVALFSRCDGFYNDNELIGPGTNGKGRRFAEGELAQVERVASKRDRVEIFLNLAEGVLEPRREGPFTLYDARTCRVQLKVPAAKDAAVALDGLLELHGAAREAEASKGWNRRRRESYPPDYERTLAAYQSWKAEQTNSAVQARLDKATDEAGRAADRMRSDTEYLAGFAAGKEKMSGKYLGNCDSLINSYFSPDTERGKSDLWRRGYEDGQRLVYNLELVRRLPDCFVPIPPAPGT